MTSRLTACRGLGILWRPHYRPHSLLSLAAEWNVMLTVCVLGAAVLDPCDGCDSTTCDVVSATRFDTCIGRGRFYG